MLILAKKTEYFWRYHEIAPDFWQNQTELTTLEAFSVAQDDPRKPGEDSIFVPEGVRTVGHVSGAEFNSHLANSKVLVGIGRPAISPTIYFSL